MNLSEKDKKAASTLLQKPLRKCSMFTVLDGRFDEFPVDCDKAMQKIDHMINAKYPAYNVIVNKEKGYIQGQNMHDYRMNQYDKYGYTVHYPK